MIVMTGALTVMVLLGERLYIYTKMGLIIITGIDVVRHVKPLTQLNLDIPTHTNSSLVRDKNSVT